MLLEKLKDLKKALSDQRQPMYQTSKLGGAQTGQIQRDCKGFGNKSGIRTTAHRNQVGTWGLNLSRLPAKTKISTFSTEFNQDPEFHHMIFRSSRIQSKIRWHTKNQEYLNSHGKRQQNPSLK